MAWFCFNDCFLSIVSKDCARDEVLVRARRKGDIEKIFPNAKVTRFTKSDYLYRAPVKRADVKIALAGEVDRITYDNFKSSVIDRKLHDAYLRCWSAMATLQNPPPYSGGNVDFGDDPTSPYAPPKLCSKCQDTGWCHAIGKCDVSGKAIEALTKRPGAKKKSAGKLKRGQ